jgi:nucleotidyltransferase/DNA polymerase involved in DNA repair
LSKSSGQNIRHPFRSEVVTHSRIERADGIPCALDASPEDGNTWAQEEDRVSPELIEKFEPRKRRKKRRRRSERSVTRGNNATEGHLAVFNTDV